MEEKNKAPMTDSGSKRVGNGAEVLSPSIQKMVDVVSTVGTNIYILIVPQNELRWTPIFYHTLPRCEIPYDNCFIEKITRIDF